jgi:Arc/MetJ-type ribon-helix-helix transcriptional regulator
MAVEETLSVTPPAHVLAEVRKAVLDGEYASSDAVLQAALSDWTVSRALESEEYRKYVHAAVQEALNDNSPGVPMDEVFDRLEAKYRALAEAGEK